MKDKKNNSNEKQEKSFKNKENNPVTMNGDSNMSKPVRGLK
ncbi:MULTISPECIES: hypothetical protein [Clostridium]|uniref:Uncharacterized protein n=1 Tax=Clostridium tagluense TaxID=360422 RepID=A0A401UI57_9CLOT|nr:MULTISPECIES: hypothetical protein [Clostridium]GCD09162.1 hypothetical protein Ctaglu_07850 [Clostridium tagluense]